ncbi:MULTISPECIES: EamA family transporter [Streptomyces]|uniref:Multidrug transporter n=1 Tax=Streptomyces canarius TaxID=285453 RepID=A0ABQ3CHR7_9ACTN|nr:EamA family transporter [Streptomyces canarius]GHA14195.1 multidrug transporter [Streptomyces canarius]
MSETLALASALCFGVTHFANGLVSRRVDGITVALYAQLAGTAVALVAALSSAGGSATAGDYGFGALSGVGTGVGVAFLYRAMSQGQMSVVVPVSDVGAVALPVLVGVALLGERPAAAAWVGIAAAVPALWLVSQAGPSPGGGPSGTAGVPAALAASAGFGVQFLAMAQVGAGGGLWPVVVSRVASVLVIAAVLVLYRSPVTMPGRPAAVAAAAGAVGTVAIILYLAATRHQLMAVATVLSALYPAIPVLLALVFLHERLTRWQAAGLVCAAAAIALIALR